MTEFTDADLDFVRPETAALIMGVTKLTLLRWRAQQIGPPYFRFAPKTIRYRRSDLLAWAERCEVSGKAQ